MKIRSKIKPRQPLSFGVHETKIFAKSRQGRIRESTKFSFKSRPPTLGERNPTSFSLSHIHAAAAAPRRPRGENLDRSRPPRDPDPLLSSGSIPLRAHRHSHRYPRWLLRRAHAEMDGLGSGGARPGVDKFLAVPPDLVAEDDLGARASPG